MTTKTLKMPFWDHLEELRWRLIKAIVTILIGAGITYNCSDAIMYWLIIPTDSLSIDLNLQVLNYQHVFSETQCSIIWRDHVGVTCYFVPILAVHFSRI